MNERNGATKYLVEFLFRPSLHSPAREGAKQIAHFLREQADQWEYWLEDDEWLKDVTWKEAVDARYTR